MIKFLHIITDDKFSEPTIKRFDEIHQIESRYLLFKKRAALTYLKDNDRVIVLSDKNNFIKELLVSDYDVLFLHSLSPISYWIFKYIPSDKVVIWWAWGYDIYGGLFGKRLFIPIDILKEKTKIILIDKPIKKKVRDYLGRLWISFLFYKYHNRIIRRIDYFEPVREMDYRLMCKYTSGFRAKEFYHYFNADTNRPFLNHSLLKHKSILIGNSAAPSENHVDVWDEIKGKLPKGVKVIIPLSYGDKDYAQKVTSRLPFSDVQIEILNRYLPREEYFGIVNSCAYAFFGSIRQHAMGNIYHALSNDIKVFLYKESVMYGYLKKVGFVIYAIEDLDDNSFSPITESEHNQNMTAFEIENKYMKEKYDEAMEEIEQIVKSKRFAEKILGPL